MKKCNFAQENVKTTRLSEPNLIYNLPPPKCVLCRHEDVSAQQYCGLEVGEETTQTIKQTSYNSKLFILMRKRIISLLALAMSAMVGSLPVMAQFDAAANGLDPDSKLILDASQLSSPASDESEGTHIEYLIDDNVGTFWHSDWHGKVNGPHYVQVELPSEVTGYYQFVFGRRNSSNTCQATEMLIQQSVDGVSWADVKKVDLEWNGDDDQGKYVISPLFRLRGAKALRFTCTKLNTDLNGGRPWHCAELQVYQPSEAVAPADMINELLVSFDRFLPGGPEELPIGTDFSQYSNTEAWEAFKADMAVADSYAHTFEDGGSVSVDDVNAIVDKVEADYRDIQASFVKYSMNDGYYRIVGGMKYYTNKETGETDLDGNPVTEKSYYDIALFSSLDGWCWWGAKDEKDARQLWKLNMVGENVKMVNAATDMQCGGSKDYAISMSTAVDTLMAFDFVGRENGHDIIYIRYASSPADYDNVYEKSIYFHQWGHEKGAGEAPHKMTLWQATWNKGTAYSDDKGTSEWYLEPVSEEEAKALLDAYELVKNHDKLVVNYKEYIDKAKTALDVAKDARHAWKADTENPVIKSTDQFHSLWTEPSEGSLDNLLDGNRETFWHSAWSTGTITGPHQASLDVTVEEPLIGTYQVYVLRRNTDDNHITRTSLYGTNDETALQDVEDTKWTLINENVSLPWSDGQSDSYSQPITFTEPFKYLRFYEEDSRGKSHTEYHKCGHYATFQIYPDIKVLPTQFEKMGEKALKLDEIVEGYKTLNLDELTLEQYNALVEAYNAVATVLVDPTELRNTIANNEKYPDYVLVGTNPGYWPNTESAEHLENVLKEATEYDNKSEYTQEQSDKYVADIVAAKEALFAAVLPVDTTKWYHLKFDTEENFDKHNWSKDAIKHGTLYGQRLAAGVRPVEGEVGSVLDDEKIQAGAELYYFSEEQMTNENASQFRFVALTDTTFAIQNRASGLFIHRNMNNESGGISLQWVPAAFTVKPIGYGQNILYMTGIDGTVVSKAHLNAWEQTTSYLGTWDDSNPGCNSHFLIEAVEDVDYENYAVQRTLKRLSGDISPLCYPYAMSTDNGAVYMPMGCFSKDGESFLALKNVDGAIEPGVPFFVIPEGEYDGETTEDVYLVLGNKLTSEPKSACGLYGTFVDKWIGTGKVVFENNVAKGVEGKDNGRNFCVPATSAYLVYGEAAMPEGAVYDIAIKIDGKFDDMTSISNTVSNVAKRGNVYSLDGQMLRQNATLNDVKSMGSGLYIINGVKVLVK